MKYLFVYEHLKQGGIETLIVRMSNWLVANNHEVILFLEESGSLIELLDPRIKLIIKDKQFKYIFNDHKILEILGNPSIDCIYTFGPKSCLIGGIIYSTFKNSQRINFFSGIYHPQEFSIEGSLGLKGVIHSNYFKKYLKLGTHVFMSQEVKKGIENTIKFNFDNSIIWPLAINIPQQTFKLKSNNFKIVSIGRLVEFKSYNLYMFEVVKELTNRGLNVTWEVYGDGPLMEKMSNLASQKEFESSIKICGEIDYNKIPEVIKDASVFVGMGTTLIEVGSYAVPCIPAIAYSKTPNTYGYLYELPYYAIGERLETEPTIPILDLIMKLYYFDLAQYEENRNKTKEYVSAYGIDSLMSKFVKFTSIENHSLKVDNYPSYLSFFYILYSYYSFFRYRLAIKRQYNKLIGFLIFKWNQSVKKETCNNNI
jgi:hypothetical protein